MLVTEGLIDYLRRPVVRVGGITNLRKVAALAELYQVKTGCHGATDLSPVSMAAALHFDISVHNLGIHEYMRPTPETNEVFPHAYSFADGYFYPGEEAPAQRFPYELPYLPVNRLADGTVHSW